MCKLVGSRKSTTYSNLLASMQYFSSININAIKGWFHRNRMALHQIPDSVNVIVSLSCVLKHCTDTSSVVFTVIVRVEVMLELLKMPSRLRDVRLASDKSRLTIRPGESITALYTIDCWKSVLSHSREIDPNTSQVIVIWSPSHVKFLSCKSDVSFTLPGEKITQYQMPFTMSVRYWNTRNSERQTTFIAMHRVVQWTWGIPIVLFVYPSYMIAWFTCRGSKDKSRTEKFVDLLIPEFVLIPWSAIKKEKKN